MTERLRATPQAQFTTSQPSRIIPPVLKTDILVFLWCGTYLTDEIVFGDSRLGSINLAKERKKKDFFQKIKLTPFTNMIKMKIFHSAPSIKFPTPS